MTTFSSFVNAGIPNAVQTISSDTPTCLSCSTSSPLLRKYVIAGASSSDSASFVSLIIGLKYAGVVTLVTFSPTFANGNDFCTSAKLVEVIAVPLSSYLYHSLNFFNFLRYSYIASRNSANSPIS